MPEKRNVLVVGGGFAGFVVARHMRNQFNVTLIDCKDYFEYTPGILRAFVHPSHFESLTFTYEPVFKQLGVTWIHAEVHDIDGDKLEATYKKVADGSQGTVKFDYCVIAAGCNFGLFHKVGESLWFPTVWDKARAASDWPHIDERYITGRKKHIMEEYESLKALNDKKGSVLIVGAGFIGVEWATEIDEYFPDIKITLCDMLPKCLGPLPDSAKDYCQAYMDKKGIKTVYGVKFNPNNPDYSVLGLTGTPDKTYISTGFKASCWFMPAKTLSQYNAKEADKIEKDPRKKGPSGGGWIKVNKKLQVLEKDAENNDKVFGADKQGFGRIYAVGDCNMLSDLPPIPKISYPGEEQAAVACRQIETIDHIIHTGKETGCYTWPKFWPILPWYGKLDLVDMWWPWGSGMFATSLGSKDACFVLAANHNPGSGYMVIKGYLCSWQKWYIEWSKVNQCANGWIGHLTWCLVH